MKPDCLSCPGHLVLRAFGIFKSDRPGTCEVEKPWGFYSLWRWTEFLGLVPLGWSWTNRPTSLNLFPYLQNGTIVHHQVLYKSNEMASLKNKAPAWQRGYSVIMIHNTLQFICYFTLIISLYTQNKSTSTGASTNTTITHHFHHYYRCQDNHFID